LVFLLTLAGAAGLGFALAGAVLAYKRVGGVLQMVWQMLVFFTGALAPISHPLVGPLSQLLPLTWGITSLRAILVEGSAFTRLWQSGLLIGLLTNTAVYILLGIVLFHQGQRKARQLGVLAHY
jgi:ABC-type polysaccharide/polyol phosphate export permease